MLTFDEAKKIGIKACVNKLGYSFVRVKVGEKEIAQGNSAKLSVKPQEGVWLDMNEMESTSIVLESTASTRISPEAIREGEAGLNTHRQAMLNRVPEVCDFASFKRNVLELKDLAYLTTKTGDKFAILRGKDADILFHGSSTQCHFIDTLADMMSSHKLELVGHSHPGEDEPIPSQGDRDALKEIGQARSIVVSGRTGKMRVFGQSPFDEINGNDEKR